MPSTALDQEFIQHLHDEKVRTQEGRSKLVLQKLAFGTALLGLGTINLEVGEVSTSYAILLAPLVALVFDFYIMGEDYSIKRIGYYLQTHSVSQVEKEWEAYVSAHRDPFAPWAMPALTVLLTAGAGLLAWTLVAAFTPFFLFTWLGVCLLISLGTFAWYAHLRGKIQAGDSFQLGHDRKLGRKINALRRRVAGENHVLTEKSYRAIIDLFADVNAHVRVVDRESVLLREYGKVEFLACVDEQGNRTAAPRLALADFHHAAAVTPQIREWFAVETSPEGETCLLPARWLCHLLGFRHGTAHLVLTCADDRRDVLVQVRGMQKVEAPGCFDLPVAGHVDGLQTYAETLRKEAGEELGLDVECLENLDERGGYAQISRPDGGRMVNVEYHRVYAARIRRDEIAGLAPARDEVAAILVMPQCELEQMLAAYPERFAGGIVDTLKAFPLNPL